MTSSTLKPGRRVLILGLVLAVTAAWTLGLHLAKVPTWTGQRNATFVGDQPLLTTADGYYYLRLAEESLGGAYHHADQLRSGDFTRPARLPPVSGLAVFLHQITSIPTHQVAFYLPPLLATLSALALALAGWAMAGPYIGSWAAPWAGLMAGLAGAASPFWFARCSLGWFDTDPLNLFFPTLAALGLAGFVCTPWHLGQEQDQTEAAIPWRARVAWLAFTALCLAGLALWWPSVGLLALPLFGLVYSASIMVPSSRVERRAKLWGLLFLAVGAGYLFLGLHRHLPASLAMVADLGDSALGHLGLVTKRGNGEFAEVGQSISELTPLALANLAQDLAGGWLPLLVAALGLGLASARRAWPVLVMVLPFLLLGALVVFAQRFVVFLVPAYALGLAYFVSQALTLPRLRRLGALPRHGLAILLVAVLAAPGAYASLTRPTRPVFDAAQAILAMAARPGETGTGLLWNWWDQGYFLQYFAHRPTVIDGGSQDPERTFAASLPLAAADPVQAANWMRFIAAHDVQGLRLLARNMGGASQAAGLLRAVFASPDQAEALLTSAGLDPARWKPFLFPTLREPVLIYLTTDIVHRGWWYYYGNLFSEREVASPPGALLLPVAGTRLEQGTLFSGDGTMALSELVEVSPDGLARQQGADPQGPVALRVEGAPYLTILGQAMYRSVACQLLYGDPEGFADFTLLGYHPFVGGLWLVR